MKTEKILITIFLFFSVISYCQNITPKELKPKLVDFLIKKKDIGDFELKNYKDGNSIYIYGLEKEYKNDQGLVDGIYFFGQTRNHSRSYMMLIKDSNFEILDISIRERLDESIKKLMDFCEQKRYCVDITNEYLTRMNRMFYNINLHRGMGWDSNCEYGVKSLSELP